MANSPYLDPDFSSNGAQGIDVGSATSLDEFYGYGTGLKNPDEIVLDISERIHMIGADVTPFFSWSSGVRKRPTHNTTFSWIEDEVFGHRDFKARIRRHTLDNGSDYLYTLQLLHGGDWQAMEAAAQADVDQSIDHEKLGTIHLEVADGSGNTFKMIPLLNGLAKGPLHRQYTAGGEAEWLNNEFCLLDTTDTDTVGGADTVDGPEIANYSVATAFNPGDFSFSSDGNGIASVDVTVHTVTPNEALGGYAQGSGLPTESRKRSRTLRNFVQIFKTPWTIANTLKHVRMYGGPELARIRMKKIVQHKVDIERAILFQGGGAEGTDWGELPVVGAENPMTRFKGLGIGAASEWDSTNAGFIVTKNGDIDPAFRLQYATAGVKELNTLFRRVFDDTVDNPSSVKTLYAGNAWFAALTEMATNENSGGTMPIFGIRQQGNHRLGFQIRELETPFGILRLVRMPHFRGQYEDYGLVIDHSNIEIRPLAGRDTTMHADAGEKYIDGQLDYLITELGFEARHESTHAILKLDHST